MLISARILGVRRPTRKNKQVELLSSKIGVRWMFLELFFFFSVLILPRTACFYLRLV